jgi:hypothetical protein
MAARIDTTTGVCVISRRLVFDTFVPQPQRSKLALVRPGGDAQGREIAWMFNWLGRLSGLTRD